MLGQLLLFTCIVAGCAAGTIVFSLHGPILTRRRVGFGPRFVMPQAWSPTPAPGFPAGPGFPAAPGFAIDPVPAAPALESVVAAAPPPLPVQAASPPPQVVQPVLRRPGFRGGDGQPPLARTRGARGTGSPGRLSRLEERTAEVPMFDGEEMTLVDGAR